MTDKKVNLFLAGAAKCGTTTLHHLLASHPDVYAGPLKEPHFFARHHFQDAPLDFKRMITLTADAYAMNYRDASEETYRLDSSVYYLYFADVPEQLARYNDQAKIVIILRNPVDRIYSHYKMLYKKGQIKLPFMDFLQQPVDNNGIDLLRVGLYSEGIERFQTVFPREQLLILSFRQLQTDETSLHSRITDFLQVAPFAASVRTERENTSELPKSDWLRYLHMDFFLSRWVKQVMPKNALRRQIGKVIQRRFYARREMDASARAFLQHYYTPELERLRQLGVEL